ncbi:MAG: hypothetical protein HY047_21275 [Acidobacteria bacterium]|nr:hypothetical protein [Acidobacteriota bacterium]
MDPPEQEEATNGDVTQAENVVRGLEARGVVEPINYESAIALSKFDKGQLQEVRIFPIWARHDGPISRRGLPMTAPPEIAQRILRRLQTLSEPARDEDRDRGQRRRHSSSSEDVDVRAVTSASSS